MTFEGSLGLNSNRLAHEKTVCFDEMLKKFFEDALGINLDKKSAREVLLRENKVSLTCQTCFKSELFKDKDKLVIKNKNL